LLHDCNANAVQHRGYEPNFDERCASRARFTSSESEMWRLAERRVDEKWDDVATGEPRANP
jgi:hypothetical protein